MKKIVLLVVILISSFYANELSTVYSYKNALYKAKKDHKLVMVMMSNHACPVCAYMQDIVFERAPILDYLNKNFYVVIKDIEKSHYPQRFSVIDSPTFFFIDPTTKKEVIEKKAGGFTPKKFLTILKEANNDTKDLLSAQDQNDTVSNNHIQPCVKVQPCNKEAKITIK